jgi:hypothetical protein
MARLDAEIVKVKMVGAAMAGRRRIGLVASRQKIDAKLTKWKKEGADPIWDEPGWKRRRVTKLPRNCPTIGLLRGATNRSKESSALVLRLPLWAWQTSNLPTHKIESRP